MRAEPSSGRCQPFLLRLLLLSMLAALCSVVPVKESGASGIVAPTFARTDLSVGNTPTSVAVGDFNNDGAPDIAVDNYAAATISVLLGNGRGGFVPDTE